MTKRLSTVFSHPALRTALLTAGALLSVARVAGATSVMEFPDNGSEQMARGGAWAARASDPLATFYNPAGLAGQGTQVTLQSNFNMAHTCFARQAATAPGGYDQDTAAGNVNGKLPQVCNSGAPFPDPQVGATFAVTDRVGIGIVVLGPSAVGNVKWPNTVASPSNNQYVTSPNAYLLTNSNVLLFTPTVGVGWEVADNFRIGAAFIGGTAPSLQFTSVALGSGGSPYDYGNQVLATIKAKDLFIPGVTAGALWSPDSNVDIAVWYKYLAPIIAKGDLTTVNPYFNPATGLGVPGTSDGNTAQPGCGTPPTSGNPCGSGNNASLKIVNPMEAKLGVRFHKPRAGQAQEHSRNPMKNDLWDAEVNLTWANNSALQNIQIRFPSSPPLPLPYAGIFGKVPANADIPHDFKDVLGIRVGGDVNVLPDQLAIRAGSFFETNGQNPTYQNIDFMGGWRFGLTAGGTYRIHHVLGGSLDISAGYGHIFVQTTTNNGPGGILALAGDITTHYRGSYPVNLGTISNSVNMANVGATLRF